jgi:hypothetical protein
MRKIFLCFSLLLTGATCGLSSAALAHDLRGLVVQQSSLDPDVRAKFDQISQLRRALAARSAAMHDEGLEAVVQTTLRWPGGRASVCFFDGGQSAREHVAQVALGWITSTSLQLDFGPPNNRRTCDPANPSNIRVSFRGSGYWSYVGTQAKSINAYKQTLNLEGMDKSFFSSQDDGTIKHEFGHAIGFEHEHQSPVAGCDKEFNWTYLYTSLGWSKDEVDRNMKQLSVSSSLSGLLVTAFDRASIMLYSLPQAAFTDPAHATCYIPQPNTEISPTDRKAAASVYPAAPQPNPPASLPAAPATPDAVVTAQELNRLRELTGQ